MSVVVLRQSQKSRSIQEHLNFAVVQLFLGAAVKRFRPQQKGTPFPILMLLPPEVRHTPEKPIHLQNQRQRIMIVSWKKTMEITRIYRT